MVNFREGSRGGVSLEGEKMQRECTLGWEVGAQAVGPEDPVTVC